MFRIPNYIAVWKNEIETSLKARLKFPKRKWIDTSLFSNRRPETSLYKKLHLKRQLPGPDRSKPRCWFRNSFSFSGKVLSTGPSRRRSNQNRGNMKPQTKAGSSNSGTHGSYNFHRRRDSITLHHPLGICLASRSLSVVPDEFTKKRQTDMRTVVVVEYDPGWPKAFEGLRSRVWAAVSDVALSVEHVGSTSVPGLAAKPIIDISVVVREKLDVPAAISRLATLGYVHRGNLGIDDGRRSTVPKGCLCTTCICARATALPLQTIWRFAITYARIPKQRRNTANSKNGLRRSFPTISTATSTARQTCCYQYFGPPGSRQNISGRLSVQIGREITNTP